MKRILNNNKTNALTTICGSLAFALLASAGTTTALAQDGLDEWEWEAGEGYHQEEWYDPTDWFDGEDGVEYENDYDDDYDTTYATAYNDDAYGNQWQDDNYSYYDDYYAAYYDGYYDGYYDDAFGYDDTDTTLGDDRYSMGFNAGYYDGYYDNTTGYDYDPYYYIYTVSSSDRDKMSDRERRSDDTRSRGDRSAKMAEGQRDASRQAMDRVRQEHRKSSKLRGTIDSIDFVRNDRTRNTDALLVRVTTEDGKTSLVNMGPKMTRAQVPFRVGDRVTLHGTVTHAEGPDSQSRDGQARDRKSRVLKAHTLTVDGETIRIASRNGDGDMRRSANTVQGRVTGVSRVRIGSDDHIVFRVNMWDNNDRLVAIKSDAIEDMSDLDIGNGDEILVRGREQYVNGREVFVANAIRVNGERLELSAG